MSRTQPQNIGASIRQKLLNRAKKSKRQTIRVFTEEFVASKQVQWKAFKNKQRLLEIPDNFGDILSVISESLRPVLIAIKNNNYL